MCFVAWYIDHWPPALFQLLQRTEIIPRRQEFTTMLIVCVTVTNERS